MQWTSRSQTPADTTVQGFEASQTVTVDGRPAHLVQAAQFWRLTATLPDGSGIMLLASRSFSIDQVVAVAGSVQVNRS